MTLIRIVAGNEVTLSDEEEAAIRAQWEVDGLDKPHSRMVDNKEVILTASEVAEIETEWAEVDRPRTAEEIDTAKQLEFDAEFQRKVNRLLVDVFTDIENRLRVLEGANAVTRQQVRDKLITLFKAL